MTDVLIDARRGAGSSLEILYGTVTWKPTLTHSRGTSIVLPAPTTYDLVDGQVVATNVQPTPEPVEGQVEWAYEVTFKDRHSKTYSFLVGVPDSTSQVNFISLPRYFETKPPLFGQGEQGIPGDAATVAVGTVTSGSTAQVNNSGTTSDAVLDFVLPKGDKGDPGDGVPEGGEPLQTVRKNLEGTTTEWVDPEDLIPLANSEDRGLLEPTDQALLRRGKSIGSQDLNTVVVQGKYHQGTAANATLARNYPLAASSCSLEVTSYSALSGRVQQTLTYTVNGRKYYRYSPDSGVSWSRWFEYARKDDFPEEYGNHARILAQALADGWVAVYDPSNPQTIDISGSGQVTELRDGLGINPPLLAESATSVKVVGGDLPLLREGSLVADSENQFNLDANYCAMFVAQTSDVPSSSNEYLFSGRVQGERFNFGQLSGSRDLFWGNGSTNRNAGSWPSGLHVFDLQYKGLETVTNIDGALMYRGNQYVGVPSSIRIGAFANSTTNMWRSGYGVLLLHPSPTDSVKNRMRNLLMGLYNIKQQAPSSWPETRTITVDAKDNIVHCKGDPDLVSSSTYASMTKMLSWVVAREYISDADMNNVTVTIQSEDLEPYGEPTFQVGDVLTLRDLAVATALPSNNTTPRTLARYIAQTYLPNPDSLPDRKVFVAHVNDRTRAWGWIGANMVAPGGGMRASMRQVANLLRRVREDTILGTIFGLRTATLTVTGPNSRTISVQHTIDSGTSTNTFSEFLTGKTGTSGGYAHVGAVWDRDGEDYISVITNLSTALGEGRSRYTELFRAMQTAKNQMSWIDRANPGMLFNYENSTSDLDITHLLPGIERYPAFVDSGVYIQRTGHVVTLVFFDVEVTSAATVINNVLPYAFSPTGLHMSTLMDFNTKEAVALRVSSTGTIAMTNSAGARLRGSATFLCLSRFPSPPYPGIISQDY